jgi:glucosamine-6-phosphate deaminase
LQIKIFDDKSSLAHAAAGQAATALRECIRKQGQARLVAATGSSQFEFLDMLTSAPDIDWSRVELFHLDEYIGLPMTHPASFRKYILDRLIRKTGIAKYHLLDGEGDPGVVARQVGQALASGSVDLLFAGIGENGHLAFNDPPADFQTEEPYLVVELDETCRRQQVNEGWFPKLEDVPRKALSMSIRQMLRAKEIIVIAPDTRKAEAVKACVEGEISPMAPCSILREHANVTLYLDKNSAALLSQKTAGAHQIEMRPMESEI